MTARTAYAGTGTLLRHALRRDRWRTAIWVGVLGVLTWSSVDAIATTYPTAADRAARADLMSQPASVLLSGPGFGLDDYGLGTMTANELGLTLIVTCAVLAVLTVVRHSRADEEAGRTELVRAAVVGRSAPLTAALLATLVVLVLVTVAISAALLAAGLDPGGSLLLAGSIGVAGLVFAGVAAVAVQLSRFARTCTTVAMGVLGTAFLVRGVGDVMRDGGSWLSWLSPIAWSQQTRAFAGGRLWPIGLSIAATGALVGVAFAVAARRDVGEGLLAARDGRPRATRWLTGPLPLAVRLQRGQLLGWSIGAALLGATFGSLADAVVSSLGDLESLGAYLTSGGDPLDAFYATGVVYLALVASAYGVLAVQRTHVEESVGRAEPLLAAGVGRVRLVGSGLVVALGGSFVTLVAGGIGLGVAAAVSEGAPGRVVGLLTAAVVAAPATWVLIGVAALLLGAWPRGFATVWIPFAYVLVVAVLGGLLGLPDALVDLSPLAHVPAMPGGSVDGAPLLVMTAISAALVALGVVAYARRGLAQDA